MAPKTIVPGDYDGAVATDGPVSSPGTEDSETERISSTVLDYVDGWYAADAERMARSIHPEVHHRFIRLFPSGVEFLDETGFSKLLKWTASGGGREIPADLQRRTVTVLDRYFRAAVARAVTATGVQHLQLGHFGEGWRIVNILGQARLGEPFNLPLFLPDRGEGEQAEVGSIDTSETSTSVVSVARDYLEGWCRSDVTRVTRALHPQLSKQGVRHSPQGGFFLESFGTQKFIRWAGSIEHTEELIAPPMKFTILDQEAGIASVKIAWATTPTGEFPANVDYLELARLDNRWTVVNVMWEPDRSVDEVDVSDQPWATWHY